jgi:integrase
MRHPVNTSVRLREKKTSKLRPVTLNKAVYDAIQPLLTGRPDDAPLFASEKTGGFLQVPTLSTAVKLWCRRCGLKGNYASHTLRKTWAYMQYTEFGTDICTLMEMLEHSSQRVTLRYISVQSETVRDAYLNEL